MTALGDANQQDQWDNLDDRLQRMWAGNIDPWAGPVDPAAYARWERKHRADVTSWRAQREQDACGCWMRDCAECMAKISDGQRPGEGHRLAWSLRLDAGLRQAKELAVRAVMP